MKKVVRYILPRYIGVKLHARALFCIISDNLLPGKKTFHFTLPTTPIYSETRLKKKTLGTLIDALTL
jgi:hypothetical protein